MNRSFLRRLLPVYALALAGLSAIPAHAGPFGALFVFGDSLSDSGNNALLIGADGNQVVGGNDYVPTFPYASTTYSNGPVWASYFATALGVPLAPSLAGGSNFAFGGATTGAGSLLPSLLSQTGQYLAASGGQAQADALYVIAGGGNNARAALGSIALGANTLTATAAAATAFASDIGSIVDQLQAAGAQHIVVWNTPDLGLAPAVATAGASSLGSFIAGAMNQALTARLVGEAGVGIFDLFGFGGQIAAAPGSFGFSNATDACGAVTSADCDRYAYWDGIHPTTAAHEAIAGALLAVAVPVPEPETWALMALGLGALAWRARRHGSGRSAAA